MAAAGTTTALATVDPQQYAIAQMSQDEIQEILVENIGGGALSVSDLDRVKVPSGGALFWEVPSADGSQVVKQLNGIIVYWDDRRAYWPKSIDEGGGGTPPNCSGRMVPLETGGKAWVGRGARWEGDTEGPHDCGSCRFNQFNSAKGGQGKGKACPERRLLAILTEDSILPLILNVPATSLGEIRKYMLQLAGRERVPYYGVVTSLSLVEDKNDGGIKYAKIVATKAAKLDATTLARIRSVVENLKPALDALSVDVPENGNGSSSFESDEDLETVDAAYVN